VAGALGLLQTVVETIAGGGDQASEPFSGHAATQPSIRSSDAASLHCVS